MTLLRRHFLAFALGGCAAACTRQEPAFRTFDVTGVEHASGFKLPDARGVERQLSDFRGRVVVVFFGYTQCPDYCPTVLADLAEAKRRLGKDGERLQVVFVTLDPERDRPELLDAYVGNFDRSFVALRPSAAQLAAVAAEYKIFFTRVGSDPASYSIDHSTGAYAYDPQGRVRLYIRYGTSVDAMVADLKALLDA